MSPYNRRPTPIIGALVNLGYKQMSNKQTREGGRKEDRWKVLQGVRKASTAAAESLSLLPADPVPVFCHRDPLLLGLVIRLWQHSRKDKQSLHQLHQEPWPHTEQLSLSLCDSFCVQRPHSVHHTCTASIVCDIDLRINQTSIAFTLRFRAFLLPNLVWSRPRLV